MFDKRDVLISTAFEWCLQNVPRSGPKLLKGNEEQASFLCSRVREETVQATIRFAISIGRLDANPLQTNQVT